MSEELRRALYASNAASLDIELFIPDLVGVTEILSEEHRKKLCRHLPARAEGNKYSSFGMHIYIYIYIQGAAFNITHFESRITHLLYTAINTTEHGQVSQCLGFTKRFTSSIQRLGDVLHDSQGNAAIS